MQFGDLNTQPMNPARLGELLQGCLSSDAEIRAQAEGAILRSQQQYPEPYFNSSIQLITSGVNNNLRHLAAALLKKALGDSDLNEVSPATIQAIRGGLMTLLMTETDEILLKRLIPSICILAQEGLPGEDWPNLTGHIIQLLGSGQEVTRLMGCICVEELVGGVSDQVNQQSQMISQHLAIILSDLTQPARILTAASAAALATHIAQTQTPVQPECLPLIVNAIGSNPDVLHVDLLQKLDELIDDHMLVLGSETNRLVRILVRHASRTTVEVDLRCRIMETLIGIAENGGTSVRKSDFPSLVIPLAFSFLESITHRKEWEDHMTYKEEDDPNQLSELGAEAIDRLAMGLGSKNFLNHASPLIMKGLTSKLWNERYAALLCIGQMAEGCSAVGKKKKGDKSVSIFNFVDAVCHLASHDPHVRNQFQAINSIGQLCTDCSPYLQIRYAEKVITVLLQCLKTGAPRVRAHAAAAIINFCEGADENTLAPFTTPILGALHNALQNGDVKVQEQAITAVASFASRVPDFEKYYGEFMVYIKSILLTPTHSIGDSKILKRKSIETVSFLASAVSKERFSKDVEALLKVFFTEIEEEEKKLGEVDHDMDGFIYVAQALCRVFSAMGATEFAPYLPQTLGPLTRFVAKYRGPGDFVVDTTNDPNFTEDDVSANQQLIDVGGRRILVDVERFSQLGTIFALLSTYAAELKGVFLPYVKVIAPATRMFMANPYNAEVQNNAVRLAGDLLQCVNKSQSLDQFGALWELLYPGFRQVFREPEGIDALECALQAYGDAVEALPPFVPVDLVRDLVMDFRDLINSAQERWGDLGPQGETDEMAEEETKAKIEMESEILDSIVHTWSKVVQKCITSPAFIPSFSAFLEERVFRMLLREPGNMHPLTSAPDIPGADLVPYRFMAVCFFDDIVEHLPERILTTPAPDTPEAKTLDIILRSIPITIQLSSPHSDPQTRQASVFHVGCVAKKLSTEEFEPFFNSAVTNLLRVIESPSALAEDNHPASDNAVSSLIHILNFQSDLFADSKDLEAKFDEESLKELEGNEEDGKDGEEDGGEKKKGKGKKGGKKVKSKPKGKKGKKKAEETDEFTIKSVLLRLLTPKAAPKKKTKKGASKKKDKEAQPQAILPLTCDLEEAIIVHTKFVEWVENKHSILMSKELFPLAIKVLIKLFAQAEIITPELRPRIRTILQNKKYIKATKITEQEQDVLDTLEVDDWFKSAFPSDYMTKVLVSDPEKLPITSSTSSSSTSSSSTSSSSSSSFPFFSTSSSDPSFSFDFSSLSFSDTPFSSSSSSSSSLSDSSFTSASGFDFPSFGFPTTTTTTTTTTTSIPLEENTKEQDSNSTDASKTASVAKKKKKSGGAAAKSTKQKK